MSGSDYDIEEASENMSLMLNISLNLEEQEAAVGLVGLLIADYEPSLSVVRDILRATWSNMGPIKVIKAKENVYSISVADEAVAYKLINRNP